MTSPTLSVGKEDIIRKRQLLEEIKHHKQNNIEKFYLHIEITIHEMGKAISGKIEAAAVSNILNYTIITKLLNNLLETITILFNQVWAHGKIPAAWKASRSHYDTNQTKTHGL